MEITIVWQCCCELQHARLPCPSLSLGACSNSCPESQQCHPTISSFVAPFPSCTQSFPASGSFPLGQLFASCGQRIRASASVFPMNTQGWFPLGLTDLISLLSKVLSRVFSSTTIWKHQFFGAQPFYGPALTSVRDYWKNHNCDYMDLCQQNDVSAFKYVVYVGHSFPSKEQASFIFMAAFIVHSDFGAQEKKVCHCFHCFPIYLPWSDGTGCLFFECWVLSQLFHSPLSPSSRGSLVPLHFLPFGVMSSAYLRLLILY